MATKLAEVDLLPDPEFVDGLDDNWLSFLAGGTSAEEFDAAFGDLFSENLLDDPAVTGSPLSGLTQDGSPSKDEEGAGSGTERSVEDGKKGSDSSNSRPTSKRLGKRKGGEHDEEMIDDGVLDEDEMKRRARLMRNRESAQLSRQRKKAYVDDLEDRVRTLNATVAELNNTVNLISAENVSLRNQLAYFYNNGSANTPAKPMTYAPPVGVPMYPYTAGGYVMRPGATAPPVPIPRLKTPATTVKSAKKARVSKDDVKTGTGKTKKLASLAAVGFLCMMALIFPLDLGIPKVSQVPWSSDSGVQTGVSSSRIGGRVLMSYDNESSQLDWRASDGGGTDRYNIGYGDYDENRAVIDGSTFPANVSYGGNVSHRFPTSILLPREDKVLKLDGDLIIQAVLAGNEATAGVENKTDIAYPPALLNAGVFQDMMARALRTPQRALPSSAPVNALPSADDADDPQKKILSELAGTVFSTGMCSEVFQFELSQAEPEAAAEAAQTSATLKRSGYHRRNLGTVPLSSGKAELKRKKENTTDLVAEKRPSSMVVSIFNPAQAGASAKDLARIFVVVLVDSVKYVTYSCMLPQVVSG